MPQMPLTGASMGRLSTSFFFYAVFLYVPAHARGICGMLVGDAPRAALN